MSKAEKSVAPKKYIFGKYAVGTECFSFVDEGRKEVLGDAAGDRKISVRMYYPVEPEVVAGKERAVIFSENKKAAIMKAYHIRKVSDEMNYADYYEGIPIKMLSGKLDSEEMFRHLVYCDSLTSI